MVGYTTLPWKGGDEQDVVYCQTQLEFLTQTKKLFFMFDSRKCWYKKALLLTKLKSDKSFMGRQNESNPLLFFSQCCTRICGPDKNAVAFELWNKAGELLSSICMWCVRHNSPHSSSHQLHFSGKSILLTSYFQIRPSKTSHHLDFSWTNTLIPGPFFPPVSFQFLAVRFNLPQKFLLEPRWKRSSQSMDRLS